MAMTLTAVLTHDPDGGYVALNPETGTTTQGDSVAEALANPLGREIHIDDNIHAVCKVRSRSSALHAA